VPDRWPPSATAVLRLRRLRCAYRQGSHFVRTFQAMTTSFRARGRSLCGSSAPATGRRTQRTQVIEDVLGRLDGVRQQAWPMPALVTGAR